MSSPRKLLITIVPFSILVCYITIRFLNLSLKRKENVFPSMHTEVLISVTESVKVMDQTVLTSEMYEKGFHIIQDDVCSNFGNGLNLLVIIMTKLHHKSKRMGIRKTWGHYALINDISIAFLFGGGKSDGTKTELNMYSDMIIEKNVDSEFNRSLKSISMMEFVSTHCPDVKYVLKTKDDVFINMPSLLKVIEKLNNNVSALYGHIHHHKRTNRINKSKHYISHNQYNDSVLPDYLSSETYLFPGHIAKRIYDESLNHIYIPAEDIFLTGIVPQKLKIKRIGKSEFITQHHISEYKTHTSTVNFKTKTPAMQYTYWEEINIPNDVRNDEE
ncbi:beta-1,3-galactosyltransferase 5-like [Onthophagus taurus]|uniref:beta-1,3-galactosyltransferase 5-like n=1 Tax=Onthophagus taurus TaxID=166361 RepID=UPI0039BDB961